MLPKIISQVPAAGRVAKFAQSLRLNLADALAGHIKILPNFFQGVVFAINQAKPQLQHLTLSLRKNCQGIFHLLAQHFASRGIHRLQGHLHLR
jgi:hypothetical protein